MTTTFMPLETRYRGYRFRSRLEARWAVLLSCLGVRWRYEPEGLRLGGDWYLPDFWIALTDARQRPYPHGSPSERGFWLEVKPTNPDVTALRKCATLAHHTNHSVFPSAGNIGLDEYMVWKWHPRAGLQHQSVGLGYRGDPNQNPLTHVLLTYACPIEHAWTLELARALTAARHARFDGSDRHWNELPR